jgi:hypothetical protein
LTVDFKSIEIGEAVLKMVDVTGKVAYQVPVTVMEGKNTHEIAVSHLPKGLYTIQLIQGGAGEFVKVVVN